MAAAAPASVTTDAADHGVDHGALYNRYRPQRLGDVVGQDHVVVPLGRTLARGKAHHAYLFSGPAGCGKTTTARIVAAAMLCEQAPVAEPCGQCPSCQAVARGACLDLVEIDAASNGGVDDARDLREKVQFAPVMSKVKVVLVDEAHMITAQGFNALLKVVEEPPAHVRFIFATTDPDKVLATIRSRTHNYRFRLVPPAVLAAHLTQVTATEGGSLEEGVLALLLRGAGGSVRTSLGLLGQLLDGSSAGRVSREEAAALLGSSSDEALNDVLGALAQRDGMRLLTTVGAAVDGGAEPKRLGEEVLDRLRDLLVLTLTGQVPALAEIAGPQTVAAWRQVASDLGQRGLTAAAEALQEALGRMQSGGAARVALEVACSRMLLSLEDAVDLPAVLAQVQAALAGGAVSSGVASGRPAQPAQSRPAQSRPAQPTQTQPTTPQPTSTPTAPAAPTPVTPVTPAAPVNPVNPVTPVVQAIPKAAPAAATAPQVPADPWAPPVSTDTQPGTVQTSSPSLSGAADPWAAGTTQPDPTPVAVAAPAAQSETASASLSPQDWDRVLSGLLGRPRGRYLHSLVGQNARVLSAADSTIVLAFDNANLAQKMREDGLLEVCSQVATEALGTPWKVVLGGGA